MLIEKNIYLEQSLLSVRAFNALRENGYTVLSKGTNLDINDLLKIKNIGIKTATEILNAINSFKKNHPETQSSSQESFFNKEKYGYWVNVLSIPISKINLSVRAMQVLKKARVQNLLELVQKKYDRILRIRSCGRKTMREIMDFLEQLDLRLGERPESNLIQDIESYRLTKNEDEILNNFKLDYPDKYDILNKVKLKAIGADKISFYTDCFRTYQKGGTLEYVAKKMGLTRERIRQILTKGTQFGLFDYTGRDYHYIDKSKLIEDYARYLSLGAVAKINGVTTHYLRRILTAYKITEKDLEAMKVNSMKSQCIELYKNIEKELGHSPTTTELQYKQKWRYLSMKISRLWGSIDAFREELQIPKPIRTFPDATRKWMENRRRIAFIIRMQNLDQIRDCLAKRDSLSCSDIAYECNIDSPRTYRLLNLLLARGEVRREGRSSLTKYNLNKNWEAV